VGHLGVVVAHRGSCGSFGCSGGSSGSSGGSLVATPEF
jgi:hypothetical protein